MQPPDNPDPAPEPRYTPPPDSNTCSSSISVVAELVSSRSYVVQLYAIVPRDANAKEFDDGAFPLRQVLDTLRALDPAADDYRFKDGFFGNERFCLIDEAGPIPLFCAYTKDMTSAPETEKKGEVKSLLLDPDEGIVDAAYAVVLPGDVVAIVRTSPKAPGAAFLSNWLSTMSGTSFVLQGLPNLNVLDRVRGGSGLIRKIRIGGNIGHLLGTEWPANNLAEQLRQMSRPGLDFVAVEQSNRRHRNRKAFAESFLADLEEIVDLLPALREASVWLTGQQRPIKLHGAHYTTEAPFGLNEHRRVTARSAAIGLMEAYQHEVDAIIQSLKQLRFRRAQRRS